MSATITITGHESVLESYFHPTLHLKKEYECGLLYFSATNSVSNVNSTNNIFHYDDDDDKQLHIPAGCYDLYDIQDYLSQHLTDCKIELKPNNNTLKCLLYCSKTVNFERDNSIGQLLGFCRTKLEPNKWHESKSAVNILSLTVIRIECDLIQGSYINGLPSHIIHEFVPNVPPGHQFVEVPHNIIYFPINKTDISSLSVKIVDDHNNPIDFRKEKIQLRLHLRKIK